VLKVLHKRALALPKVRKSQHQLALVSESQQKSASVSKRTLLSAARVRKSQQKSAMSQQVPAKVSKCHGALSQNFTTLWN
jgi:hypothetical protein